MSWHLSSATAATDAHIYYTAVLLFIIIIIIIITIIIITITIIIIIIIIKNNYITQLHMSSVGARAYYAAHDHWHWSSGQDTAGFVAQERSQQQDWDGIDGC